MRPGRKPVPPSEKAGRGTLQPVRDGLKTEIIVPGDPPIQPDYMTAEADTGGQRRDRLTGL